MKRIIAVAILAVLALARPALGQTMSVEVVVKQGLIQKIWNILLRPKTVLQSFACDATEMEPGDVATCTLGLNQPARGAGVVVTVTLPAGFSGPASVTIPAGSATATFTITRQELLGALSPRIYATRLSVWAAGLPRCGTRHYAQILVPRGG